MNTKKDYQRAAQIVQRLREKQPLLSEASLSEMLRSKTEVFAVEDAFIEFFRGDNPAFDEDKFCEACKPKG